MSAVSTRRTRLGALVLSVLMCAALPAQAAPRSASSAGTTGAVVERFDIRLGGPVFGDGITVWLNFTSAAAICDEGPATTTALQRITLRDGTILETVHGDVPFVVTDWDGSSDPCAAADLGTGTARLSFHDNDQTGSGGRANSFGVGFTGSLDADGRNVSGHLRFRVTKKGAADITTTRVTFANNGR